MRDGEVAVPGGGAMDRLAAAGPGALAFDALRPGRATRGVSGASDGQRLGAAHGAAVEDLALALRQALDGLDVEDLTRLIAGRKETSELAEALQIVAECDVRLLVRAVLALAPAAGTDSAAPRLA